MKKQYISLLVIALAISCQVLGAVTEVNLEVDPIISHHYSEAEHNIRDILSFALPSATLEPGDVYRVNVSFTNGKLLKVTGASYVAIGPVFSTAGYGNILGLTNNGNIGLEITSYQNILNTSRSGTAFCRKVYRGDDYYFEKAFFFERSLGEIVDGSLFEAFTVEFTVPTTVEGAPFSTRAYSSNSVRIEADLQNTFWDHNILTVIPRPSKTYYVDTTEGSDNNDGLSPETPFATIQKAIDSAFDGDTVLVADGTYTGPGNRDIDFRGKAITVRSIDPNDPNIVASTIIDCNGTETKPHRGFYFHNGEDANSIIAGLTITNGYALWEPMGPMIPALTQIGGAIYCGDSSPTITNCTIVGNSANYGDGAGIGCVRCDPKIKKCIIKSNVAAYMGGGIYCKNSNAVITNCIFSGNSAADGGGICSYIYSSPIIVNCTISGNKANGRSASGAGIYCCYSWPTISNCTITDNSVNGEYAQGGAASCYGSSLTITNCILWHNEAQDGPEIYLEAESNAAVTYSDIQGGWPGEGNIDYDPCFAEPGYWADANDPNIIVEPDDPNAIWIAGDYHLLRTSPCIDAAADANVYTDIEGNIRPFDFPGVDNNDELPEFDMGAYELVPVEAAMKFTPQMLNCNSKGKYVKAHLTLPEEFLPQDVEVNEPALAEPMNAYSEYIKVLGAGIGPVRLEICFDREAFCAQITETGEVEITVIGSLTTSRYFYGSDTIRIKPRR